jgi:hypothetical protein
MKAIEIKFNELEDDIEAVKIVTVDEQIIYVTYDGEVVK